MAKYVGLYVYHRSYLLWSPVMVTPRKRETKTGRDRIVLCPSWVLLVPASVLRPDYCLLLLCVAVVVAAAAAVDERRFHASCALGSARHEIRAGAWPAWKTLVGRPPFWRQSRSNFK